ncbi:hypothetical protein Tco_1470412 [Tanacetum coccineum]
MPTTLGEAFSLVVRITEARSEAITHKEKEQSIKETTDTITSLRSEVASPEVKGSLDADEDIGVDEKNKESMEEVVMGGGEALGVGEDDDTGNATMDGDDDAVESRDISILNSLIGHESPCSSQLWGTIGTTDVQVLIDKRVDK